MKKYVILLIAVIVTAVAGYRIFGNVPPTKDEVKKMIYDQAKVVLSYENANNPLITALVNNAEVRVEKVEKGTDGYVATCKIGNRNFKLAYDKCMSNAYISTLTQFTADFIHTLNQEEMIYETTQINVIKDAAGKYQAEFTEYDIDIFTGGFITCSASFYAMNR